MNTTTNTKFNYETASFYKKRVSLHYDIFLILRYG